MTLPGKNTTTKKHNDKDTNDLTSGNEAPLRHSSDSSFPKNEEPSFNIFWGLAYV